MKRVLKAGWIWILIMALMVTAALADAPLTRKEIIEQVAVPLALENDIGAIREESYTADQLARLIKAMEENGYPLEETNELMQAVRNGRGYYEEETIMELCRQAFGGNYYTWPMEEQDWFQRVMVDIGFYETYTSSLPGEGNMTCEEAEAFALRALRETYGEDLHPEDRSRYTLSRQFYQDPENGGLAAWSFTLQPKEIEYGTYSIWFEDARPEKTIDIWADVRDWSGAYDGNELLDWFRSVYGWNGSWSQATWRKLHDMLQTAQLNEADREYPLLRGIILTDYPELDEADITREQAVQIARDVQGDPRTALTSAVLTEYEGVRAWLVTLRIRLEQEAEDDGSGTWFVAVDSRTGEVLYIYQQGAEWDSSASFVPEGAYEMAHEGVLGTADYFHMAAEALQAAYPGLNPLDENEFTINDWGGGSVHSIYFRSKVLTHGNATVMIRNGGEVSGIEADMTPLDGDNLLTRYWAIYGFYGQWDQDTWVKLREDAAKFEPETIDGKLLKMGNYPEESSVSIDHAQAMELAMKASGKRSGEINTCVLIDAEPHPVWKLRIIADDAVDPVIELDAETGEVVAVDAFRTDYTPTYVLYSLERNWRPLRLEMEGAIVLAKEAVTYAYGDMWLDFPELDVENPEEYEIQQDGLTVCFLARWKDMKSYEVELDEKGYVLRCEEKDSESTEERPARMIDDDFNFEFDETGEGNG